MLAVLQATGGRSHTNVVSTAVPATELGADGSSVYVIRYVRELVAPDALASGVHAPSPVLRLW